MVVFDWSSFYRKQSIPFFSSLCIDVTSIDHEDSIRRIAMRLENSALVLEVWICIYGLITLFLENAIDLPNWTFIP